MPKILDKRSTEYLRSDIEYEQLFEENTGVLEVADLADLQPLADPVFAVKFHTTGNGIVHLKGRVTVQQAITTGTVLFTFPMRLAPGNPGRICRATLFTSPNFNPLTIAVQAGATETEVRVSQDFGVLGELLILDSCFYLLGG